MTDLYQTELGRAVINADLAALPPLLPDPDTVLANGQRPLSLAAGLGNLTLVDFLVEHGLPIDARDSTDLGYTALITATQAGALAAVQKLLALGADVHAGDSLNGRALHHAAVVGATEIATTLLAAGAEVDAVDDRGATALVRVAVHADAATFTRTVDGVEETMPHPLHAAHLATAAVLLDAGADPGHLPSYGYSPLHHAAENGAADLLERLLAAGGRPDLANGKGYTPLHAACSGGKAATVQVLLAHGAEADRPDGDGFTALHEAAMQGSLDVARLLLAAGADPSRRTESGYGKVTAGMTAAAAAAAHGFDELATVLAPPG